MESGINKLLNLIFPKNIYCICCGDSIEPNRLDSLCFSCREKINWIVDNPYEKLMDEFSFDELLSCTTWGYYTRKIMSKYKSGARYLKDPLGQLMAERFMLSGFQADAIVFVPSTKEKEKHIRGFNPAKLLAFKISELTKLPVYDCIWKNETTKSSRSSSAFEREINILDIFEFDEKYSEKIKGAKLLLVDDIVTTGSTADSISRMLKNEGAAFIAVLCFSCGNKPHLEP